MSAGHASATVYGNLGSDPEKKVTQSGVAIAHANVAVGRYEKNKDGQGFEKTTWIRVKAFGKAAEFFEKYFKKGDKVMVTGELIMDSWETENGERRTGYHISAWKISFGASERRQGGGEGQARSEVPF